MELQRRDTLIARSLGGPLIVKVMCSRVLLVGAGGIGCELLKNLVCSGFGSWSSKGNEQPILHRRSEIVVVDLDTIDLSNLNRQFLFRKQHIKKPKAFVAKETASHFNPSVNIDAHYANITDPKYDVDFFEGFDLVFNALDNLVARRHVNKMCLAANVPLIESGTTGFNGQVQAIQKGVTECYDCNPKPVQRSFPICTIRSTPSQPIHCIVWAKSYLLPELFGTSEDDSTDMAVTEGDNAEEVAKLRQEAEALKKIRHMMGKSAFAQEVFNKVFHDDIERLRSMEEMWQNRKAPESLKFDALAEASAIIRQGQTLSARDQQTWTLLENIAVFCYSLDALSRRTQAGETTIEFDKDDKDTLDFVASAANLRSHIFGIALHSEWEIKQMAGNIIPAIATSNALTASLCVLEALKVLRNQASSAGASQHPNGNGHVSKHVDSTASGKNSTVLGGAKTVFLASKSTERLISPQDLAPPRPDCPVCSPVYAKVSITPNSTRKLSSFVDMLKTQIGYEDFAITTDAGMIYDPDLDDNLDKPLVELGIGDKSSCFVSITDDSDEPRVDLVLSVKRVDDAEEDALKFVSAINELPRKHKAETSADELRNVNDVMLSSTGNKRKREAEDEVEDAKKRAKSGQEQESYVVEDDGAILLDE